MQRLVLLLAAVAWIGAIVAVIIVSLGGALAFWTQFFMHALVIGSFVVGVGRLRSSGVTNFYSAVPAWAMVALPITGAVGAALMAANLLVAMPRVSPSGNRVHSYSATVELGECRVTFNRSETVIVPIEQCQSFQKSTSLAFAGAWLLFGSIGLWMGTLGVVPAGSRRALSSRPPSG